MKGIQGRRTLRRGLDVALRPLGGRIITRSEEQSIASRHQALVRELYWANAVRLSPALVDRPGRSVSSLLRLPLR